jgi:hypothetical protein
MSRTLSFIFILIVVEVIDNTVVQEKSRKNFGIFFLDACHRFI